MVGKYDEILQPQVIDERFDYILFSNEISAANVGVWQVKPIHYTNADRTRVCRYIKTHPESLLPQYQVSVWMDSNVRILTQYFYDRVVELDRNDIVVSSMWHPVRDCIYQEAFAVVNMLIEHESIVVDWCSQLRKENYPEHNGLCETSVTYRKHNDIVAQVDALWWDCIEHHSRRDQLSFNYVLWKLNVPCHYFLGIGKNVRNTEHTNLVMHKDIQHNVCALGPNEAWLMRHCWKNKSETKKIESLYFKLYALPFPKLAVALMGQLYRIKDKLAG